MKVHEAYKKIYVATLSLGDIILMVNNHKLNIPIKIDTDEHYEIVLQIDRKAATKMHGLQIEDDPQTGSIKIVWPEAEGVFA